MPLIYRAYEPRDFAALHKLDQSCFPAGIAYSRSALHYFLMLPSADCIVAVDGKRSVGFILTEENPPLAHHHARRRTHTSTAKDRLHAFSRKRKTSGLCGCQPCAAGNGNRERTCNCLLAAPRLSYRSGPKTLLSGPARRLRDAQDPALDTEGNESHQAWRNPLNDYVLAA